jgi:Zn-dependent protease
VTQPIASMPPIICRQCRSEIAATLLSCPACHRLVHGERLSALAAAAREAEAANDLTTALSLWREALELLPRQSQQFQTIAAKVETLGRTLDASPRAAATAAATKSGANASASPAPSGSHGKHAAAKSAAGIGAIALLLWKFKAIAIVVLSKGKLLLLGLTKSSTLFTMFASLGVYWTIWGWRFALGLVLSIYVHEMGHVAELRRRGFRATAPMFIPGLGAVIRLQQRTSNPHEDARIGLAGPIWGLGAAAVAAGVFVATGAPIWAAIARVGAWINLFNLLPVWQLDGSRGWRALSKPQAWLVVAAMAGAFFFTRDGMTALIAIVAAGRTLTTKTESPEGDVVAVTQFVALVALLSALSMLPVPASALP